MGGVTKAVEAQRARRAAVIDGIVAEAFKERDAIAEEMLQFKATSAGALAAQQWGEQANARLGIMLARWDRMTGNLSDGVFRRWMVSSAAVLRRERGLFCGRLSRHETAAAHGGDTAGVEVHPLARPSPCCASRPFPTAARR